MDYCLHTAGQEASKMLELDPLAKAFHTKEKEGNNRICCKGTRMYKQIPQNDNMVYIFGNHLYFSKNKKRRKKPLPFMEHRIRENSLVVSTEVKARYLSSLGRPRWLPNS
jgi:hypothetical protein